MIPPINPLSPFEVFRMPILIRRFTQGFYLNGEWQEGSQITLSTILVTGNIVNITLNSVILSPITFSVSAAHTMGLIQSALLAQPNILVVDISSNLLTITVCPLQPNLSVVNSFTVTGGASQPTINIANSPLIIPATASVQPIKGRDVALVPEGRRDSENYHMFTSTEIMDLSTQNPDQVQILSANFTNFVYEVIRVEDWQNNYNFNIVNHFHFIALRLHPLP